MPVRLEINNGMLQVLQSFDRPAVYLDHWAVREFSSNPEQGSRLLDKIKDCGGCLVISHVNLVELTGAADPAHAEDAAQFFERALPHLYFAMFDIEAAINQERQAGDAPFRLGAPPDIELLRTVALERPDDLKPLTIARLIRVIAANRERLQADWNESNQTVADHINNVRSDPEPVRMVTKFASHSNLPTTAIMQELLRPIFMDQSLPIGKNDSADIHHAITSIAYCDYVLLDGKWADLHERMVKRFGQLGVNIPVAEVFSKRRNGVALFLQTLEQL